MSARLTFFSSCVDWPREDVDSGLIPLVEDAKQVTRATFLRRVDPDSRRDAERSIGYESHPRQGLTMAGDWHVAYFRSHLHGRRVYFFVWSATEFVFT